MTKSKAHFVFHGAILIMFSLMALPALGKRMARAESALRSMAPPMSRISIDETIKTLKTQKQDSNEIPSALEWAVFAKEVVGVKSLYSYTLNASHQVLKNNIIQSIHQELTVSDWKPITDKSVLKRLGEWNQVLKKNLGEDSYSWAWVQFQMGETSDAKKILAMQFESEYNRLLKLQVVITGLGGGPLDQITKLEKTLTLLSTKSEKVDIQKKMKRVKIHLSNLPESQVVT